MIVLVRSMCEEYGVESVRVGRRERGSEEDEGEKPGGMGKAGEGGHERVHDFRFASLWESSRRCWYVCFLENSSGPAAD